MTRLALELNDGGILAQRPGSPRPSSDASPGFALIEDRGLLVGRAALAQARLRPRRVHSRFWIDLDTTPLNRSFGTGWTAADLAHAHLAEVWAGVREGVDEVLLVVPGSHDEAQLGLILGIARVCEIPVRGLIDAAVAATATVEGLEGMVLHLDLQLHRAVLTELELGAEIARRGIRQTDEAGLLLLWDLWAQHLATAFVAETRFDPLRAATSEQDLYSAIPPLIERLNTAGPTLLELATGGQTRDVRVDADQLVAAAERPYAALTRLIRSAIPAGRVARLVLSHRAAMLPGLVQRLGGALGRAPQALAETATLAGALGAWTPTGSAGDELTFVTRLRGNPHRADAATDPAARPTRPGVCVTEETLPTHVLVGGMAHPIDTTPLVLGTAVGDQPRSLCLEGPTAGISRIHCSLVRRDDRVVVEDRSSHGSFVNGRRVEGRATLQVGDRLVLGSPGIELRLIRVRDR